MKVKLYPRCKNKKVLVSMKLTTVHPNSDNISHSFIKCQQFEQFTTNKVIISDRLHLCV